MGGRQMGSRATAVPRSQADRTATIARQLRVQPLHDLPEIALYTAHPGSALAGLATAAPYWAYVWAGGAALARHVLATPDLVQSKRVLDLGAGSGVVAIAAALAGAAQVVAVERDPWGRAAVRLNAALNRVAVTVRRAVPAGAGVDVVLCGDVFYSPEVAAAVTPLLDRLRHGGARVVVGDPGRADLALNRLTLLARYPVRDVGDQDRRPAGVYDYDAARKHPAMPHSALAPGPHRG